MKKKNIIIITVAIVAALIAGYIFLKPAPTKEIDEDKNPIKKDEITDNKNEKEAIKFLRAIKGIKADKVELIDKPVGLKGEFLAPRESILSAVDYFLKDTKNDKMEDIKIDIGEGFIKLTTNYKVNSFITTPIEMKVAPSIDKNKDLVLNIKEVKIIDLKLADWIVDLVVDNFVKDWFPKEGDLKVKFNEGYVVIDKNNFKEVILEKISIDSKGLTLDMIINLEQII